MPRRGAFLAAGADPPLLLAHGRACARQCAPASPARLAPGSGQMSLRTLLRDTRQQSSNLCLPVSAVAAEGSDRRQLSGLGPPRYGLRVSPEHRCDLRWGKQRLGLWCTCRHSYGLSSWTGTAILRVLLCWLPRGACRGCPIWSTQTILPSPAVTSRPPGAKFLLRVAPLLH